MERQVASRGLGRRQFIGLAVASAAGLAGLAGPAGAGARGKRALGFHNLHTGERLETVYWADGAYRREALRDLDHILRDFRTGEVRPIQRALLDLLAELRAAMDSGAPFELISGYRSPVTNETLRRTRGGIAKNSYHTRGMAADVRLPGRDLAKLCRAALALARGGVGYYPQPNFVHLDVGPVRRW